MGSLMLDVKNYEYTFRGGSTFMIPKKGDYKNIAFEMYIHTPVDIKVDRARVKRIIVPKTIKPDYININVGNFKQVKTAEFFKNDPLNHIEVYYCKDVKADKALVIGFVSEKSIKSYYILSEINKGTIYVVEISSFRLIKETELLDKLYEENYIQNKVLTIKIDTKDSYPNVNVTDQKISGSDQFQKYIHTPGSNASDYTNLVLDCNSKCEFKGFVTSEYSNVKLQEVCVYFHDSDSNQRVPLMIEFKPKPGQRLGSNGNGKSVYYELKTLDEKKIEGEKSEWTRGFKKVESVNNIAEKLNQIYSGDLKYKIYDILGISDNSTVIGAVSGTVGTISAIGTGVGGFFIYKNSALVITFLKSLF